MGWSKVKDLYSPKQCSYKNMMYDCKSLQRHSKIKKPFTLNLNKTRGFCKLLNHFYKYLFFISNMYTKYKPKILKNLNFELNYYSKIQTTPFINLNNYSPRRVNSSSPSLFSHLLYFWLRSVFVNLERAEHTYCHQRDWLWPGQCCSPLPSRLSSDWSKPHHHQVKQWKARLRVSAVKSTFSSEDSTKDDSVTSETGQL